MQRTSNPGCNLLQVFNSLSVSNCTLCFQHFAINIAKDQTEVQSLLFTTSRESREKGQILNFFLLAPISSLSKNHLPMAPKHITCWRTKHVAQMFEILHMCGGVLQSRFVCDLLHYDSGQSVLHRSWWWHFDLGWNCRDDHKWKYGICQ